MSRTKAFEPAEALDRAMDLFWRQGYSETVLDELVRHTRASRYGLYATFGGKRDLFLGVLERYSQAIMDPMIGALEGSHASASEIRRFFARLLGVIRRRGGRRGCLMCNTAFERGPIDSAAAARVRRHFDRVRRLLARALANARRDGALADGLAVPAYADHLLGAAAGSFFLARSGLPMTLVRRFVDTALRGLS
ncbi:MAG TPA: TetR/AcrR family transcriptional regulator [Gemmatimonadales bacterium]|nr:TetR/AcrR family transcriptional regulator [Gemmatimonadales bacterium]